MLLRAAAAAAALDGNGRVRQDPIQRRSGRRRFLGAIRVMGALRFGRRLQHSCVDALLLLPRPQRLCCQRCDAVHGPLAPLLCSSTISAGGASCSCRCSAGASADGFVPPRLGVLVPPRLLLRQRRAHQRLRPSVWHKCDVEV